MASIGDMRTILTMDTSGFVAGVKQAEQATNQLAYGMNKNLGRSVTQVGFMIQDFSSVMATGGPNALGRAIASISNNVQMLGMAFGPWGMAISAVGGALAGILLPKLFEGDKAMGEFTKRVDEHAKAMERLIQIQRSGKTFELQLGRLGPETTGKQVQGMQQTVGDDIAHLTDELSMRREGLRKLLEEAAERGGIEGVGRGGIEALFGEDNALIKQIKLRPEAGFVEQAGYVAEDLAIKLDRTMHALGPLAGPLGLLTGPNAGVPGPRNTSTLTEAAATKITELFDELSKTEKGMERLKNRAEALGPALAKALANDQMRAGMEQIQKHTDKMMSKFEGLRESTRTPFEKFQERISELRGLSRMGGVDQDVIDRASDAALKDFRKGGTDDSADRGSKLMMEGSAEAQSFVQAAIRSAMSKDTGPLDKQLAMAQKLLDETKKQTEEMRRQNRALIVDF